MAWDAIGGSKVAAKVGGWAQDRIVDGAKGVKNVAEDAWMGTNNVFSGIAYAFGFG